MASSWIDNSTNETGFEIQRAPDSSFTTGVQTFNVAANVPNYDDTTVTSDTTYSYRVRAKNAGLSSDWSNIKQVTTPHWTANLAGSFVTAGPSYNFTSLGSADSAH